MAELKNNTEEIVYNVLTFGNNFVDEVKLFDGVYFTNIPKLRDKNETLESIVLNAEELKKHWQLKQMDDYIENVKKCELKKVKLYL